MADSRRTQMTKTLLKTALIELLQEKPLHKISVKELCDRADLNRTTFYLHYEDQTELFNDLVSNLEKDLIEYIPPTADKKDNIMLIHKYLEYVKNNSVVFRTLMGSDINGGAKTRIIRDILTGMRNELPRFGTEDETRYFYVFMVEGVVNVIIRWIDNGFDLTVDDLAKIIYRLSTVPFVAMEQAVDSVR